MQNKISTGYLAAAFTVSVWGTTFTSTKILLRSFTPVEIMFTRLCIAFFVLLLAKPQRLAIRDKSHELVFAAAGLCGVALYYLLENTALSYTTAGNVGVIISASPFFTGLLSCIFLKAEKPGLQFYIGFLAAIIGIGLISLGDTALSINPLGDLMALGAASIWAVYSLLSKKIGTYGYGTVQSTRRVFGYGILIMLPLLYLLDFRPEPMLLLAPLNLFNLLFLGVCASAICFATWNFALRSLGAVKTSVFIYLVPVLTLVTSAAVLHEPVTSRMLAGMLLTLFGLFLSEFKLPQRGLTAADSKTAEPEAAQEEMAQETAAQEAVQEEAGVENAQKFRV